MSLLKIAQTVTGKIIQLMGLGYLGLALATGITTGSSMKDISNHIYLEQQKKQIETVSSVITNYYRNIEENVNFIAEHPYIQQAVAGTITSLKNVPTATFIRPSKLGSGVEYEIYKLFEHFATTHPTAKYVYLATADGGYTQWPEVEMPANYDPTTRGWYQSAVAAKGEVIQTDPYTTTDGGSIISNARAVYAEDGSLIGVVGIDFEQSFISELVENLKIGDNGYYMLIHPNGTILADGKYSENLFKLTNEIEDGALVDSFSELKTISTEVINGSEYTLYSDLIEDNGWTVTGLISNDDVNNSVQSVINKLNLVTVGFAAVAILLIGFLLKRILAPIRRSSTYLNSMSEADFSVDVEEVSTNMPTEVFNIIDGIAKVKNSLVFLLSKIGNNSACIKNEIVNINQEVYELKTNMQQISATSEELAASMQETSALTEEMLITSQKMQKEVESVEDSTSRSLEQVNQIRQRANDSITDVTKVQANNSKILESNKENLEIALEHAKVVGEINELANAIMQITEQTNLLALNASIEAARAGEQGRGFAVVAEEIGKLADQSKTMTLKIQEVTSKVTSAVYDLSDQANGLLEFIEINVLKSYEALGKVAEAYKEDANDVETIAMEFKNNTQALNQGIKTLIDSINAVATASTEGAVATTEIAGAVSEMSSATSEVSERAQVATDYVTGLEESMKEFRV